MIDEMDVNNTIKVFDEKQVRTAWDPEQEKWFFSIIDVIAALTGNDRPRKYWNDLKSKLLKEGSELSDKMGQLKMLATDGKNYMTDVAVASCLAMTSRAALPAGPINPIVQGRVPQEVVGASGFGSLGRDHI